jgi:hypothetical protein
MLPERLLEATRTNTRGIGEFGESDRPFGVDIGDGPA